MANELGGSLDQVGINGMANGSILVTGASGFIGSHVLVALADAGYRCVSVDNFANSRPEAVAKARDLTKGELVAGILEADIRDRHALARLLANTEITGVIHLAGLKSVAESTADPVAYYDNNVGGTTALLSELRKAGVRLFVFSSSATVYSPDGSPPFVESSPLGPVNPYGRTKLMIEQVLDDLAASDSSWKIAKLRYFNPVGAHPSGTIGENPLGAPNNLMPAVCMVASGRTSSLRIFGNDYPTTDGTGIRDYIHVMDLAEGHVSALRALEASDAGTLLTANLGTGHGISVLEMVKSFERVNAVDLHCEILGRRPGDVAISFADCSLARAKLHWAAKRSLEDMCRDAWNWTVKNPNGF